MAPAVAAALVQGGATLGSGLLNLFSGSDTNKTNLQIARETNQQNRELFNQQLAWQEDMWNKTNAYNDPSHQVELLQKAGINPAAVYGNGSTSPASMPSVPSANPMQSASVAPLDYSFISQGVDNGINAYFENQLKNNYVKKSFSDAQIADLNAQFETRTLMDRCRRVANDTSKSEFERETARMELKFLTSTFDQRVMQSEWSTKIMSQQYDDLVNRIAESKLRQKAQEIANEFAPQANDAQLKQYYANIAAMYSAARASDASAAQSYASAALAALEGQGVSIDNRQKSLMNTVLLDTAKSNAREAKANARGAELRNMTTQSENRYGRYTYNILGSALPQAEEKIKSGVKAVIKAPRKAAEYLGGKKKQRHGGVR